MPNVLPQGRFRKGVSWAFAVVSFIALAVFNQAIAAFVAAKGWDQLFISGWQNVVGLGLGEVVAFALFVLGGATLGLWGEFWLRNRQENKAKKEAVALSCTANFQFAKQASGELSLSLDDDSENVRYYVWYLNNGGTMHNEAVMIFVEFEKPIPAPQVLAHSETNGTWEEFSTTDRYTFVQLKGWPEGRVVIQAIDSTALGLDRRSELRIWRKFAPLD